MPDRLMLSFVLVSNENIIADLAWPAAPRVGDHVRIGERKYPVQGVVWTGEDDDYPQVDIELGEPVAENWEAGATP